MATTTRHQHRRQGKRKTPAQPPSLQSKQAAITAVEVEDRPEITELVQGEQVVTQSSVRPPQHIWLMQRPVVGSLMIICAGILVLWGPLALMQFAFLPGNTIWAGLLVGATLCALGLLQLFFPTYAIVTGSLAIICALVSLMAAAGGFGIGMLLGIIGGAQGVAWHNTTLTIEEYQRLREEDARQPHKRRWKWPSRPATAHP